MSCYTLPSITAWHTPLGYMAASLAIRPLQWACAPPREQAPLVPAHVLDKALENLLVAEEATRLLHWAALQRSVGDLRSVLALVAVREHNARNFHQLLHGR